MKLARAIFGVLLALTLLPSSLAAAAKLAGVSADGTRILVDKAQVCEPVAAEANGTASGTPVCQEVTDKKALKGYKFKPPPKAKTAADGVLKLSAVASEDQFIQIFGAEANGKKFTLVSWDAGHPVLAVKGPFATAKGKLMAVEYTWKNDAGAKQTDVVAFDVTASLASAAPPAGGVAERVILHNGKWRQALVACETAGVTMTIKKNRTFSILVETKCQGSKDRQTVAGAWDVEEPGTLLLTFTNYGGPQEVTRVTLSKCPDTDEECLSWQDDDVQFLLLPATK